MAAITQQTQVNTTTDALTYTSPSFTPAAGELLVVEIFFKGSASTPVVTNSAGLTFDVLASAATNESWFAISKDLTTNVAQTVTVDLGADNFSAAFMSVKTVSGMTRTGSGAVLQSDTDSGGAGTTPTVTFPANVLTGNPTIAFVDNDTNPAGLTQPTGWTERNDLGVNTPTSGFESVSRDSGFTGTTITWGSTSATAWESFGIELDTSVPPAAQGGLLLRGVGT